MRVEASADVAVDPWRRDRQRRRVRARTRQDSGASASQRGGRPAARGRQVGRQAGTFREGGWPCGGPLPSGQPHERRRHPPRLRGSGVHDREGEERPGAAFFNRMADSSTIVAGRAQQPFQHGFYTSVQHSHGLLKSAVGPGASRQRQQPAAPRGATGGRNTGFRRRRRAGRPCRPAPPAPCPPVDGDGRACSAGAARRPANRSRAAAARCSRWSAAPAAPASSAAP